VNVQEINRAIVSGQLTNADLNSVIDAVKFARARLTRQNKASLMLGDTVQFTSTRTGRTMQGTVQKIAIKFVTVNTPGQGLWRVPASMLTAV
jgi:ribosomal protein L35AE/L33A